MPEVCRIKFWFRFWRWYFQPKSFELAGDGRIYRCFGIRIFKRYLPTSGDLVSRARKIRRIDPAKYGLRRALERYDRITRHYEARHILGAISMLLLSWWSIHFHHKGNWLALILANIVINGYPIMLQRYNRARVYQALSRLVSSR